MNQADILKLAVSAGYDPATLNLKRDTRLVRFAELVAQHEKERICTMLEASMPPENFIWEVVDKIRGTTKPKETTYVPRQPCIYCGSMAHKETCDSPGAQVTGTTGCPVYDKEKRARSKS